MTTAIADGDPKPIYLMSYPKIVLLYPTFLASIAATIVSYFWPESAGAEATMGLIFLGTLGINLVVLSFDFPRTTSLTLFFLLLAVVLGLFLFFVYFPTVLPVMTAWLKSIEPRANATFYLLFTAILGIIYAAVAMMVRMDYWEIRPNEVLHHHGFLSNLERFSAPNLRISKEITDVFEYALLRSGRLILHPSNEPRAFVLDNVPFIDRREEEITKLLGTLQVSVRHEPGPPPPQL